jgi:hypothetical protein
MRTPFIMLMRLEMGNVTSDFFTGMGSAATAKARRTVVNKDANLNDTMIVVRVGLINLSRKSWLFILLKK